MASQSNGSVGLERHDAVQQVTVPHHSGSAEVVADLADREVERCFKGGDIPFGLGEQQSALQGGQSSQREPVDIGTLTQLAPVAHAPESVTDRGFPAVEARGERGPGGWVGLGEFAGQ
jgi:hypothetical protein